MHDETSWLAASGKTLLWPLPICTLPQDWLWAGCAFLVLYFFGVFYFVYLYTFFLAFCTLLFATFHKTGCELDGFFLLVLFSYFHLYMFLGWNSNGQFSCRHHWGHSGCQERTVSFASNIRPLLAGEDRLYPARELRVFIAFDKNKAYKPLSYDSSKLRHTNPVSSV